MVFLLLLYTVLSSNHILFRNSGQGYRETGAKLRKRRQLYLGRGLSLLLSRDPFALVGNKIHKLWGLSLLPLPHPCLGEGEHGWNSLAPAVLAKHTSWVQELIIVHNGVVNVPIYIVHYCPQSFLIIEILLLMHITKERP